MPPTEVASLKCGTGRLQWVEESEKKAAKKEKEVEGDDCGLYGSCLLLGMLVLLVMSTQGEPLLAFEWAESVATSWQWLPLTFSFPLCQSACVLIVHCRVANRKARGRLFRGLLISTRIHSLSLTTYTQDKTTQHSHSVSQSVNVKRIYLAQTWQSLSQLPLSPSTLQYTL